MKKLWIYHYQRILPKAAKKTKSVGNVTASVFWDTFGFFCSDHLELGQTINSDRSVARLLRLKKKNAEKLPQMKNKKSALSSTQCTVQQVDQIDGKNIPIKLRRPQKKNVCKNYFYKKGIEMVWKRWNDSRARECY